MNTILIILEYTRVVFWGSDLGCRVNVDWERLRRSVMWNMFVM